METCRVLVCPYYGKVVKELKEHLLQSHHMTIEDNMALPPCEPKYHDNSPLKKHYKGIEGRCYVTGCDKYGHLFKALYKHLKNVHDMTQSKYEKLYLSYLLDEQDDLLSHLKEVKCRVVGCSEFGKVLGYPKSHLAHCHRMTVNQNLALPDCSITPGTSSSDSDLKNKTGVWTSPKHRGRCLVTGCDKYGKVFLVLYKHLSKKHNLTQSQYEKLYAPYSAGKGLANHSDDMEKGGDSRRFEEVRCKIKFCSEFGKMLADPAKHLKELHNMSIDEHESLLSSKCVSSRNYVGDHGYEEKCLVPDCKHYGKLFKALYKHLKNRHNLTYRVYKRIYLQPAGTTSAQSELEQPPVVIIPDSDNSTTVTAASIADIEGAYQLSTPSRGMSFPTMVDMSEQRFLSPSTAAASENQPALSSNSDSPMSEDVTVISDSAQAQRRMSARTSARKNRKYGHSSSQASISDVVSRLHPKEVSIVKEEPSTSPLSRKRRKRSTVVSPSTSPSACSKCNDDLSNNSYQEHIKTCGFKKCPNEGCDRTLPSDDLEKHLIDECDWRTVVCRYCEVPYLIHYLAVHLESCGVKEEPCPNEGCPVKVSNKDMVQHKMRECEWRRTRCCYCKERFPFRELKNHESFCSSSGKISCEVCEMMIDKEKLDEHQESGCSSGAFECPLASLGCDMKTNPSTLQSHLEEMCLHHIYLLSEQVKKQKEENKQANQQISLLQSEISFLSRKAYGNTSQSDDITHIWKIDNFQHHLHLSKAGECMVLYGQTFSTGKHGYRLYLGVYPNGFLDGIGSHTSIYLYLTSGDYDSILPWPFRQKFTIAVLDQTDCSKKEQEHIKVSCDPNPEIRPEEREMFKRPPQFGSNQGWGKAKFIPHSKLFNGRYIKDNCMMVLIKVAAYDCENNLAI